MNQKPSKPRGLLERPIMVHVDAELDAWVTEQAEDEERSVSSWVRLRLEEERERRGKKAAAR